MFLALHHSVHADIHVLFWLLERCFWRLRFHLFPKFLRPGQVGNELGVLPFFLCFGYIVQCYFSRVDVSLYLKLLRREKRCCGWLKLTWTSQHIHEGTRLDSGHKRLCHRMIQISNTNQYCHLKQSHCSNSPFWRKLNSPVSNSPWPLNKSTDNAFLQG